MVYDPQKTKAEEGLKQAKAIQQFTAAIVKTSRIGLATLRSFENNRSNFLANH